MFRVLGVRFRVKGFFLGFGLGFWIFGLRVLGFGALGLGFGGFGVWVYWFRVDGLRFLV